MSKTDLSVVIPVFNEKDNVEKLAKEILAALKDKYVYEIIFVNDGSNDGTKEILDRMSSELDKLVIIHLSTSFGQTQAMAAGIDHSLGEIIITMDGDLQNDPNDIPILIEKIKEGNDLVCGWRFDRKDQFINRKIPSYLANLILQKITGIKLHDYGCSLKAYKSELIKRIKLYGDMHRLIPAYAQKLFGAQIIEVKVNHRPRINGKSKYGLFRIYKVIVDIQTLIFFIKFRVKPIHLIGFPGIISLIIGSISFSYLMFIKIILGHNIGDRPLLSISIFLIMMGIQFLSLGVLSEILIRIYHESTDTKTYIVKNILKK